MAKYINIITDDDIKKTKECADAVDRLKILMNGVDQAISYF